MAESENKTGLIRVVDKSILAQTHRPGIRRYGSGDAAKLLNIPMRTVLYWSDEGLITPEEGLATGKGSRRYFSVQNLLEMAIFSALSKLSFDLDSMRQVHRRLRETGYFDNLGDPGREHEVAMVYINESGNIEMKNGKAPNIDENSYKVMVTLNLAVIEREVAQIISEHEVV